ncbi:MAG: GNAT family N-acetyltransferase [Sphingobacteriales bacterium]|nr:GNAT family N-acetyltransferase [Sphingobacteriales bacterium]MBI3718508.1 GNAT family N-acetyltransferase [Sphingobacteriales bacterium]
MENIIIRQLEQTDNKAIAQIIRNSLAEFGANKQGTVYYDPTTDDLYSLFTISNAVYYVAELNGELVGGAGIFPTDALPDGYCELVKMYLKKEARGSGLGRHLIDKSLQWAKENGYTHCYLETMPELRKAVSVYEKFGFSYLNGPLGNSGHFGCDVWMIKEL